MKDGDKITLKAGAVYYNGASIPDWVKNSTLYYRGKGLTGVKISTQKTGAITGVVNSKYINGITETTTNTTVSNNDKLGEAVKKCVEKVETLPEFKEVLKLL